MKFIGEDDTMANSLAALLEKNEDKLVDQTATSLKVMFGLAYSGVAQEELIERLEALFDSFIEIAKRGGNQPALIEEIVESVLVEPLYHGWSYRSITEEVLRVVDMVTNHLIDSKLDKPDQAEDKEASKALLVDVIRASKEVVNGRERQAAEERLRKSRGNQPVA